MKRSNWFEISYLALSLLTLVITYSSAKPYQEIHHLLTDDEREAIFGHPSAEFAPEYEISYPVQVNANGRFLSQDLAHGNIRRKRDIGGSSKESVFFKLSAFGQEYHLNVTLNDELFSPHFKTEVRGKGSSEFHYDIEHCHYLGQLLPKHANKSKVAVSNCDGLQGMILTPQDLLMVHPLPERLGLEENKTRPHLIHRRSTTLDEESLKNLRRPHILGRRSAEMNFPRLRTIESMIVVEKVMTKFYGAEAIKTYVPTIVNIAHGLLADASIGANIKYIISKLLILTDEDMGGLVLHNHAGTLLTNFCNWTVGQNVGDDSDPAHFDHAALISKYNFCRNKGQNEGEGCGTILGLADLKGMCTPGSSCTLSKDTGLGTAFTMAHETAHNLGSEHDAEGNQCEDGVNIMASKASGKITAFDWSSCSRKYITRFLETAQADCLNDGANNSVPIPSEKPGILYNGNTQCEQMFGKGSRVCDISDLKAKMCVNLHCEKPDGYCTSNDEPAAEGTECDTNKWCSYGKCVTKGTKGDKDVNGNWGAWGDWSKCFPSCGGGISKRVRKCNNPAPRRGGSLCEGKGTEYRYCYKPGWSVLTNGKRHNRRPPAWLQTVRSKEDKEMLDGVSLDSVQMSPNNINKKCRPNSEHPRMKQCVNKRHVEFDGGPFDWIYDPSFSQDSPKCVLSCATTDGQTTTFGSVRDGTPCSDIPNSGVCINGQCKMVGCDGTVDSRARVDRCGVCNGDGSSCSGDRNQGNKPEPQPTPGAKSIQPISTKSGSPPSTQPTATITVDDKDDGSSEDSDFPDRFRVTDKVKQELDGAAQSSEQLKTKWIISSQGCSVSCGEGIEAITAVCVREDDESAVGDQFCEKKRPGDQFKRCSMQLCPPS